MDTCDLKIRPHLTPASPSLWYKTQHNKKLESRTVKDLKWKHNFLEDLTDDQSQTFII